MGTGFAWPSVLYKDERLAAFRQLVGSALATLEDQRELVDWFDFCTRLSEAQRS